MSGSNTDLNKVLMGIVKAARQPSRFQRLEMARSNMKKAASARKTAGKAIQEAHAMHKSAYLAKSSKAKKPDDDGDFDHVGAMEKLQKAYSELQKARTFDKAAGVQLKKAAGRSGQRGQEVSDSESGFYEVPAGVKDLSPSDLATAGPGTTARGSEPPIHSVETRFPGKAAKGGGMITQEAAAILVRNAKLEAENEILKSMPAGPVHGRRPAAFDTTRMLGDGNGDTSLFKGVDANALGSDDENVRKSAVGKVIGNMITTGRGRSVFDPAFHGAAGVKS